MRRMNQDEMDGVVSKLKWASICTVDGDGKPYAVEATPFFCENDICFMINPKGTTAKNLAGDENVLLKYTYAGDDLAEWAGVSLFGRGSFEHDPVKIRQGWSDLGAVMGADYGAAADKFCAVPENSPMLRVRIEKMTGRCSARVNEPFSF